MIRNTNLYLANFFLLQHRTRWGDVRATEAVGGHPPRRQARQRGQGQRRRYGLH